MLHSPPPPAASPVAAAGLALAPVPRQRALSGRRIRKPAPDDAELLELGRQLQASRARQHAITASIDASKDTEAAAFKALLNEMVEEAEAGAQIRRQIACIRATTWPGVKLKIELATWAYDVDDEEFAHFLDNDKSVTGEALAMSLCRDLRTWFAGPGPDAELLRLDELFEAAWQVECALDVEFDTRSHLPDWDDDQFQRKIKAAGAATGAIVRRIEAKQATTLAGLIVKARAVAWTHAGEAFDDNFFEAKTTDKRLATAVLADLLKLDGRPLPTVRRASTEMEAA